MESSPGAKRILTTRLGHMPACVATNSPSATATME
jgi:hypothetical protein